MLIDPNLDLDTEDEMVGVRFKLADAHLEPKYDIRIERQPVPMRTLATSANARARQVDVLPLASEDFGSPHTCAFHQQDWRSLVPDGR
jgi:hypothetical protein